MELSLRRWRPGHLLASWAVYWAGLAGVTLGPAARAAWRATHLPEGHGSIAAAFDNGVVQFTVVEEGAKTFIASAPFGTVLAWIIGPPLAIWLVWLAVRTRGGHVAGAALGSADVGQLSPGAGPVDDWRPRPRDRVPADQEKVRTPNP